MKTFVLAILFAGLASIASAQDPAIPTSQIGWQQAALSLAEANGYTYRHYDDGSGVGELATGVTCSGTSSPFTCQMPFPEFTPGAHSLRLTAANVAGESLPSVPLNFVFTVTPATPVNLVIIP